MLIFCCRGNTNTNHGLAEVGSALSSARILFNAPGLSGEPNISNKTRNRLRTGKKQGLN